MRISIANNRQAKTWVNKEITWEKLVEKLSTTQKTVESLEEFLAMKKSEQDEIKDVGGFVLGHLKQGLRRVGHVLCRSGITLDMDFATPGIIHHVKANLPYSGCVYGTHKYSSDKPRLRLIFPLSRDVSEEEYEPVARMLAKKIGMDLFDDSTYEANRMMFWPSTPSNIDYYFEYWDGQSVDPDKVLAEYNDWHDISTWPTSSRQSVVIKSNAKRQADPLTKKGIVGVFCRTYSVSDAIEKFLSDVYRESEKAGRYDYIHGTGFAGVQIFEDKFAYSHHATDPAYGKLLNSFDLVRTHKFSDDDDKKSFQAMSEWAVQLPEINSELLRERRADANAVFEDWQEGLKRDKHGRIVNDIRNLGLILDNDENLKGIVFNELADGFEIKSEVPWKHPHKFWRDADDAQLRYYIDTRYGTFSKQNYDIAVTKIVDDRSYHPIKEYLESLPPWDGVPRAETLLIDYLGADDTPYVRAVTRKVLCAAVKRIYHPGIKFDTLLVLVGRQGLGKSTLVAKLGGNWFSDSLSLSDINDGKAAAEKLQGVWIMEIPELAGMRKIEQEKVKAFISRQDDRYRSAYGRNVQTHPRQCILFGTTNEESGFLRDITGNRRYWPVNVSDKSLKKPWDLTAEDIAQIWAEVLTMKDESLTLSKELLPLAEEAQDAATETDERTGVVEQFLEILLPDNWEEMDLFQRREYLSGDRTLYPQGTVQRQTVSNIEIWCECFGNRKEDFRIQDGWSIRAIMRGIKCWQNGNGYQRQPIYGKQRVYRRNN